MAEDTAKAQALDALNDLPEDATLDDAIERLCFLAKLREGLRQSERGEVVPHEEIKKQFDRIREITTKLQGITTYETKEYISGSRIVDIDKASKKP